MKTIMKPPPAKGRIAKASLLLLTLTLLILSACAKQELPEPEKPRPKITKATPSCPACGGVMYSQRCPDGLWFNAEIQVCDFPENCNEGDGAGEYYFNCPYCSMNVPDKDGGDSSGDEKFALSLRTVGQELDTKVGFVPSRATELNAIWYTGGLNQFVQVTHDTTGKNKYETGWSSIFGGGSFTFSPLRTNVYGSFGFRTASSGGGSCTICELQ